MAVNPGEGVQVLEVEVPDDDRPSTPISVTGLATNTIVFNGACRLMGGCFLASVAGSNLRFYDGGNNAGLEVAVLFIANGASGALVVPTKGIYVRSALSWTFTVGSTIEGVVYVIPVRPHRP